MNINIKFESGLIPLGRGSFFFWKPGLKISPYETYCRDSIQSKWNNKPNRAFLGMRVLRGLWRSEQYDKAKRIIAEAEERLGLKTRSEVFKVNRKTAIVVHVAPFWRQTHIKRSIFTLLLRAALLYGDDGDRLEAVLQKYCNESRYNVMPALMRFFSGYTKEDNLHVKQYYFRGFVYFFSNVSGNRLANMLVKEKITL